MTLTLGYKASAEQFDPRLSWDDVAWIRERWGGKLILKGILDPEDARMAAETGSRLVDAERAAHECRGGAGDAAAGGV